MLLNKCEMRAKRDKLQGDIKPNCKGYTQCTMRLSTVTKAEKNLI